MCLNPISIRNPTKCIAFVGGQKLNLEVPCGKCAECIVAKRNEWYFRTYYEVQSTLSQGGYVLFDTLTYSDEYLPHLSDFFDVDSYGIHDFSCFNLIHFKNFLKNLRRQLHYHYNGANFRYFLTSEYGEDDKYTHRPHYHIMFFVTDPVSPITFSKLVSKCWPYGHTDGIEWHKSIRELARHVYGYNLGYGNNTEASTTLSVCMYVSKYITKNSKFQKKLAKRVKLLQNRMYDDVDKLNEVIRNIDMFHRQSQGFGLYYLDSLDDFKHRLLKEDKMVIPDKDKIHNVIPLPMYYRRKLYYILKKKKDKKYYWELTEEGKKHYFDSKENNIFTLCESFNDIYKNADIDTQNEIDYLLNGRTPFDYYYYKTYYQGRLRSINAINHRKQTALDLIPSEANFDTWINTIEDSLSNNSMSDDDCYLYDSDSHRVYLSTQIFQNHMYAGFDNSSLFTRSIPYSRFCEKMTFNENTCESFNDFDKLDKLLYRLQKDKKREKQQAFDFLEDYKERMKANNLIN